MLNSLQRFAAILALVLGFSAALPAASALTVLSLSYSTGSPSIHIGSNITVNMVVLDVTTQLSSVSVSNPNIGSLDISSPDLASTGAGYVYISDGTRTWKVFFAGGPLTTLTISNANLLNPGAVPNWSVPSYIAIQSQTFKVYLGNSISGASPGSFLMKGDLGSFGAVVLGDGPSSFGDAAAFDEIWSGVYEVPDLGMVVTNSRVYGHAYMNSVMATNDGVGSPQTLNVDALRPAINTVNFTVPSRPNYNNVLYLTALCQGTSVADPTNSLGRFDVQVNKTDTVVDITIGTSPPKSIPSIIIPAGAQTLNGWATWKGDTGAGLFAPDGVYPVSVYIHDSAGITGLTHTSQVVVTSMRFEVANIQLLPSGRTTQPTFDQGLITVVTADIVAYRDNGGSLRNSLLALGWPDQVYTNMGNTNVASSKVTNLFNGPYMRGGVFALQEVQFLDSNNVSQFGIDTELNKDGAPTYDNDYDYVGRFTGDSFGKGDDNKTTDWTSSVLEEMALTGTVTVAEQTDPTFLRAQYGVQVIGKSPSQGNYRVRLRSKLTGLYAGRAENGGWHFYPDAMPEGLADPSGLGILCDDSSFIFQVSDQIQPSSDSTAPVFIGSGPVSGSTISPGTYGPSTVLYAKFQDLESAMNSSGAVSYITVTDPSGGRVAGLTTTDGGGPNNTLTITFQPYSLLSQGGNYKMTVNTCNNAGLCVSKDIAFTVLDQTPPSVSAVELVHRSGGANEILSLNQSSAEGPFDDISEVWVTLSIPATSTNTIAWDLSSVTLYQIVGTNRVPVPMDNLTVFPPTDGRLKYRIKSSINYAGQFEVDTLTVSKDASGQTFSGPPAGTIKPQFTTQVCVACVTILYPAPGNDATRPAITAFTSDTLTAGVVTLNPLNVGVDAPPASALPADAGWSQLNSVLASTSMRFFVSGVLQTGPLTWTYSSAAPVTFAMYYNDADLPTNIQESDLAVRAYSNGSWSTLASAVHDSLPATANAFRFAPTSSQPAALYYAIKYTNVSGTGPGPQPTATPFTSTRSFSPVASNPVHRKAMFFYGGVAPTKLEVRIFDTAGRLVRSMALGQGVSIQTLTDSAGNLNYYFDWDGQNDSGTLVRNGLYLVRWTMTLADGSSDTITKPVAMIK